MHLKRLSLRSPWSLMLIIFNLGVEAITWITWLILMKVRRRLLKSCQLVGRKRISKRALMKIRKWKSLYSKQAKWVISFVKRPKRWIKTSSRLSRSFKRWPIGLDKKNYKRCSLWPIWMTVMSQSPSCKKISSRLVRLWLSKTSK